MILFKILFIQYLLEGLEFTFLTAFYRNLLIYSPYDLKENKIHNFKGSD